ncbi:Major pollen allergen Bet v 1-J [Euphorbia peplus]|nr:Major pollen allergen Bet v 1-J [Euphorbia peplus]
MGVVTVEKEITSSVPQTTIFKLLALENHTLVPKAFPSVNCDVLQGNGGTMKKTTFNVPGNEWKYGKTKDEVINKDNFSHSYTIVEGDPWIDSLDKIVVELKYEAAPNGGSVLKNKSKFIPKQNCTLDEARIHEISESMVALYKHFEAQLLANPTSCN